MQRIQIRLLSLVLLFVSAFSLSKASSFNEIISQPDYEEQKQTSDYLEFDDFLTEFQYYCNAWDGSFDTSKKQTKTLDDGRIVLQLDGVTFWVKVEDNRHEITQISVKFGDPKNEHKADYSMLVKVDAVIATLEYKKPLTSAERSSILSSITNDFQLYVEPAVKYARTLGSFPVTFYNSKYSYAVTFSETESYDLVIVISDNTQSNSEAEKPKQREEPEKEVKDDDKVQIEITEVAVGKDASITAKNNRDWIVTEISFRIRYYDKDGKYILTDNADDPVNNDIATLTIPIDDGGLIHRQSIEANATGVPPFVAADRVDLAVSGFKTDEGLVYYTPESDLDWYSSESGYLNKWKGHITQKNYFDEWFADGKQFSLGIYTDYVYPEFEEYYGVDQCGYLIAKVEDGSILDKKGVHAGDVLYKCNDWLWSDDPLTLDRAKHELIEGRDMTLLFARDKETITVVVTPEDIK